MQVVINIAEESYKELKKIVADRNDHYFLEYIIAKGIPLPKGHGRLIDADKTLADAWQNFYKHEDEWEKKDENYLPLHRFYDQNGFECCQQTVANAPTIIEADTESEGEET